MSVVEQSFVWGSWRRTATDYQVFLSVVANLSELLAVSSVSDGSKALVVVFAYNFIEILRIAVSESRTWLVWITQIDLVVSRG
jgi:hypothetical protein